MSVRGSRAVEDVVVTENVGLRLRGGVCHDKAAEGDEGNVREVFMLS